MLTNYPDLLPPNATPFERALSGPTGRITAIPVPIRDLWRWDTCPEANLPWLAWAMSVDFWNDAWPIEKKRAMVRESFELHRRKGTLYAVERYIRYADSKLERAIVPPDKPFAAKSMSAEERAAYLARFPQIRIHQYRDEGVQHFGTYAGSSFKLGGTFASDANGKACNFAGVSTAWERYGRRAFLWDKGSHPDATGQETVLRWLERTRVENNQIVYDHEQVLIPGAKVQALFAGASVRGNYNRKNGRKFALNSAANNRVVTISMQRTQSTTQDILTQKTVRPALEPIKAFPERIAERGTAKLGAQMFAGMHGKHLDLKDRKHYVVKGFAKGFAMRSSAGLRLYDRIYLHDKNRQPDQRPGSHYAGYFRLGMPAYHAKLSVSISGRRSPWAAGRFCAGFALAADRSRLDETCTAIVRAKALRDKVLLKTGLHRPLNTRDMVKSGDGYRSGDLILSA